MGFRQLGKIYGFLSVVEGSDRPLLGLVVEFGLLHDQLDLVVSKQHFQDRTVLAHLRLLLPYRVQQLLLLPLVLGLNVPDLVQVLNVLGLYFGELVPHDFYLLVE